MKKLNLFDVLQNPAIGVIAIHSFILGYNNVAKNKIDRSNFPPLNYLFFILPIVYDDRALTSIKNELYTTISNNKEITLGLQEKSHKMFEQTLESLNLGFSKNILILDKDNYRIEIEPRYNKNILSFIKIDDPLLKSIQTNSRRLGSIFAKKDEKMIQIELDIRF
ncbi:three component ABC system middle component [Myroides odoratimimus]|uniref:three component ABC system middle component n=1 Tax=Myroides odoratimimus TaxID=76832 RepID=UPI00090F1552|nr:three component ABC system middle component [Myroides odoratimimus]MDM1093724.1 hypothetical protein [Myroides odoratimimus]SHM36223.1 hypothetical protein SAMN05444275_11260 [Myroides odoratimimus subsp. xuanwuensis]